MAHDETIRIYRSNVPGAEPPSLTYGELAANLADRKVFVGGPGGTADMIVLLETPEATGLPLATTGASGVASFFGGDFTVSTTGHVFLSRDFIDIYSGDGIDVIGGGGKVSLGESITIRNVGVTSFNGATGSISLFDFVQGEGIATRSQGNKIILTNIGVTGISAGHTGISLNGTTGSLQIFNMGVLSVDGQTGHIDLGSIIGETGDTVLAGLAIGVARNNNQVTINNLGVTSFNGQTGAVTYSVPLATNGLSGVASFQLGQFSVSNTGHVSLASDSINLDPRSGIAVSPDKVSLGGTLTVYNTGVTSFNGATGSISLFDFVEGGEGILLGSKAAGTVLTITNLGVTSFNGQTGGVQYSPPIATHSVTGVAFFPPADFQISNGSVSLTGNVARTTVQNTFSPTQILLGGLVSSAGITSTGAIVTTSASGFSGASISTATVIHPVGGLTIKPPGTPIGTGAIKLYGSSDLGVVSYATIDSGTISDNRTISLPDASGTIALTNSVVTSFNGTVGAATLTGDGGAIRGAGNNAITARLADTSVTGVAFFDSAHFTVDTGRVSLKTAYTITGNTVLAGSGIAISPSADNTKTIINVGVTGILQDDRTLTGAVRFNSGKGITFSYGSGGLTFANTGVLTINSLTPDESGNFDIQAATVVTGDGGALVGDGVRILARLATSSLTGVASFPTADFGVVDGSVSLTGNVARTNLQNVFSATQILSAGLSASGGITSNGTIVTTNSAGFSGPTLNTAKVTHPSTGLVVEPFGSGVGTIKFTDKFGGNSLSISPNSLSLDRTISFPDASGTVALTNAVVTSLNGNVGALTITGDGAAIRGVGNNIIGTRLADTDVTGVAFFDSAHFTVNTGRVSLKTAYTITGDTVLSGVAIGVARNSNEVRINNLGVTSFNGLTGAVTLTGDGGAIVGRSNNTIGARLATTGVTGVASYNPFHFGVVNGEVSLHPSYQATGDTVTVSAPLTISRTLNDVRLGIGAAGNGVSGVASFDSTNFNVTTTGHVSFVGNVFSIRDERGTSENVSKNSIITITGGQGIDFLWTSKDNFAIRGVTASTTAVGVASYNPSQFTVNSSAQVSLASLYATVGVTGISAGHTGIALSGTTGNVQIFNMGVHTFNGATGHITFNPATGDTITSGLAIGVSVVSGNNKRIDNLGVTSFNGVTGAVVYAPSLATLGASGVASFLAQDFSVSNTGHVSLSSRSVTVNTNAGSGLAGGGSVNLGGSLTLTNIGVTGISAGHTGIALSGTTGSVQIWNMGVLSINGQTGHYTLPASGATGDTVVAGVGVSVVRSGNQVTVNNMGVTSFNGLTGAVTLTGDGGAVVGTANNRIVARLVTSGTTGIASFNTTHFSVSSSTGHVSLASAYTATGDTITSGLAIGVSVVSGNNKRIDNLGVTSFNGLTGAVTLTGDSGAIVGAGNNTIGARLATASLTGVASFPSSFFSVSNGAVSLSGPYGIIGVTGIGFGNDIGLTGKINLTAGTNISLVLNPTTKTVTINSTAVSGVSSLNTYTGDVTISLAGDGGAIQTYSPLSTDNIPFGIRARLATVGVTGVASFDSSIFTVSTTGHVSLLSGLSLFTIRDEVGGSDSVNRLDTLTITGGQGIDFLRTSRNNYAIRGVTATTGVPGVASFLSNHFAVSSTGHVSLASAYTATGDTVITVPGSGIAISTDGRTDTLFNIGVTGVTTGSGISVSGTTGNIRISNMGVTSFNGLTGAVTLTGDGGAIIGAGNNIIRARLANETTDPPAAGTTGVAAFFQDHFIVTDSGLVKLLGGGGGGGPGPLGFPTSGMGASFAGDNSLSFAYVDFGNLATGSAIDTVDQLVFFDDSATSVVKTRKISVKNFFQDNTISDIFSTATPGQLARTKDGNVLQWSVVTSNIGAGQEGLVKGATAFAYIAQNTVKSINGQTGDVECIAVTCAAQTFTGLQTFITGISTANLTVSGGATFGNISASNIVNSLNGLTGARTLTGDGGAIIGSSNTTIGARLASSGATGVASFPTADFGVSITGVVSLTGNVARTNTTQTFTALQSFSSGISASGGMTFNGPITTSGYRYSASSFVNKTAGFTLGDSADDNGKVFVMNNTINVAVTVKQGLPVGFCAEFLLVGPNRVSFEADAGVTLTMYDTIVFPPNRVQIISYATDTYLGTYAYSNY